MTGFLTKMISWALTALFGVMSFLSVGLNFHKRSDDVLFSVAAVSDTHITDSAIRRLAADACFNDITNTISPDLLIIDGDLVDEAKPEYYEAFAGSFTKYCGVENVLLTIGNHDTWEDYSTPHEYGPAREKWLENTNALMKYQHDEVYYHYVQDGYHFIVLGQEATATGAVISDAQIAWMEEQLTAAEADSAGKPVFVLLHQPMSYTHGVGAQDVDGDDSSFNEAAVSEKFRAALDKYPNIFFISGHTHAALNSGKLNNGKFSTIEKVGENITSINLPSMIYPGWSGLGSHFLSGGGAVINVYEDRVEIRGRNFITRTWTGDVKAVVPVQ